MENNICTCGHLEEEHSRHKRKLMCLHQKWNDISQYHQNCECKKFTPLSVPQKAVQNQTPPSNIQERNSEKVVPLSDKMVKGRDRMFLKGQLLYAEKDIKQSIKKILERIEKKSYRSYNSDNEMFKEIPVDWVEEIIKSEMGKELSK